MSDELELYRGNSPLPPRRKLERQPRDIPECYRPASLKLHELCRKLEMEGLIDQLAPQDDLLRAHLEAIAVDTIRKMDQIFRM